MSSIKIIEVPPGFAPLEVREQWVGVELPLATEDELRQKPIAGKIGNENDGGYIVLRVRAIEALRSAGKLDAAHFWESLPFPTYLQFRQEVCALVA